MLKDCKISVFPEYHSMGRLINNIDNKQTGLRVKDDLYLIDTSLGADIFCLSSWFRGDQLHIKSGDLNIEATGDKEWNSFVLKSRSGVANVFINGEYTKRIKISDISHDERLYLRASPTTTDHSPLRDFRYYERSLSEKEFEEIVNFSYYNVPNVGLLYDSYFEIYASNAANMFPTHF